MNFKRIIKRTTLFMLLFGLPILSFSYNGGGEPEAELSKADKERLEQIEVRSDQIMERVEVLRAAKKEADTRAEKKEIKSELKELKKEMKALYEEEEALSGGIYIGGGALIVILLLILLL